MGNEQLLEKFKERLEKLPEIRVKHLQKPNESAYTSEKFSYLLRWLLLAIAKPLAYRF
jgi:hypothetical protein